MMCTRRVNFLELLRETETDLISRFGSHFGDSQRAKSDISLYLFTINETAWKYIVTYFPIKPIIRFEANCAKVIIDFAKRGVIIHME